jgi:hypothetical protein
MDNATLITIIWSIVGAVGTGVLGLIFFGIKKLVTTTIENTIAIQILSGHIEAIIKLSNKIEKLERDVNSAHDKIRNYSRGGENGSEAALEK